MTMMLDFPWQRTLSLTERLDAAAIEDEPQRSGAEAGCLPNRERRPCPSLRWRDTLGGQFNQFLAAHALTETAFSALLTEEHLPTLAPRWALDLAQLLESIPEQGVEAPSAAQDVSEADLYALAVKPWLERG